MNAKHWFSEFARGTALGTGILPGVSAGTVGMIVNVYDELIEGIDGLRKKDTFKKSLFSLLPIGAGCLIATFLLMLFWSKVAVAHFPFILIAALAGFVFGALPVILVELKGKWINVGDAIRIGIGFIVAAGIGICAFLSAAGKLPINLDFQGPVDDPFHSPWVFALIFFVGFLAAFSCLVPGISGSMILFIFGLYTPILNLFFDVKKDGVVIHESILHDTSKLGGGITIIAALLLGMLIGFFVVSFLMKKLIAEHRRGTFTIVLGFVLGSLVSMFFNDDMYDVYTNPVLSVPWQYIVGAILFVLTAVITFLLVRKGQIRNEKAQKDVENGAE